MRKISDEERIDQIFISATSERAEQLFTRVELIRKLRNLANGTQPAKRGRPKKDKPINFPLVEDKSA